MSLCSRWLVHLQSPQILCLLSKTFNIIDKYESSQFLLSWARKTKADGDPDWSQSISGCKMNHVNLFALFHSVIFHLQHLCLPCLAFLCCYSPHCLSNTLHLLLTASTSLTEQQLEGDLETLAMVTYSSLCASMLALVLTVLVLSCLRGLKSNTRSIHSNTAAAMFLSELVFLSGVNQTEQQVDTSFCQLFACLHLVFLFYCKSILLLFDTSHVFLPLCSSEHAHSAWNPIN